MRGGGGGGLDAGLVVGGQGSVARMTDKEICVEFEKMLDNMNLSDEKKEPLRRHPISKKKELLDMHFKSTARVNSVVRLYLYF